MSKRIDWKRNAQSSHLLAFVGKAQRWDKSETSACVCVFNGRRGAWLWMRHEQQWFCTSSSTSHTNICSDSDVEKLWEGFKTPQAVRNVSPCVSGLFMAFLWITQRQLNRKYNRLCLVCFHGSVHCASTKY